MLISQKAFGDFSTNEPHRSLRTNEGGHRLLKLHFVDPVIPFLSYHSRPFAHQSRLTVRHRDTVNSLPPHFFLSLNSDWFLPPQKKETKLLRGERVEENFSFQTGEPKPRQDLFPCMYIADVLITVCKHTYIKQHRSS